MLPLLLKAAADISADFARLQDVPHVTVPAAPLTAAGPAAPRQDGGHGRLWHMTLPYPDIAT